MRFTDDQIRIEPGHVTRHWQSCDYYFGDVYLFHERSFVRSRPPGQRGSLTPAQTKWVVEGPSLGDCTSQWFDVHGTRAEIKALAARHGGKALEDFYSEDPDNPGYFLAFGATEKALAFCRTEDFDALCMTFAKLL